MFSNRIANSARFLQMPAESQLLYFHLVLRSDDDGVTEAYPIIQLLGSPPDCFKVLLAKGLIKQLNEDQVVVITDWLEHNKIRSDRKIDSIYKHLLPSDIQTIEAKPRSDVIDNSKRLGGQSTDGISKVRLGKVRLSKDRKGKVITKQSSENKKRFSQLGAEVIKTFESINPACKKMYNQPHQREACDDLIEEYGFEKVKNIITVVLPKTNGMDFFPTITTPLKLRDKWVELETAVKRHNSKKKTSDEKYKVAFTN